LIADRGLDPIAFGLAHKETSRNIPRVAGETCVITTVNPNFLLGRNRTGESVTILPD